MNFIEHMFGVSPDGGSGATEAALLVALAVTLVVSLWSGWAMRRRS